MQNHKRPPASLLFIFGGSGDLNHRKLSPALYNLFIDEWMPEKFGIVGIGRRPYDDPGYRNHLLDGIKSFPAARKNKTANGKSSPNTFLTSRWMSKKTKSSRK